MNTTNIVIGVVVIFLLYLIYKFYLGRKIVYREDKELIKLTHDATLPKVIKDKNIPASKYSNEYSYSFWINIDNYDHSFKQKKNVFVKGTKDGARFNPEISLDPVDNNILVRIQLQGDYENNGNNGNNGNVETFNNTPVSENNNVANISPQSRILNTNLDSSKVSNISGNCVSPTGCPEDQDSFYQTLGSNQVASQEVINHGVNGNNQALGSQSNNNNVPTVKEQFNMFNFVNRLETFQNEQAPNGQQATNGQQAAGGQQAADGQQAAGGQQAGGQQANHQSRPGYDECRLYNVPLQKWAHIVISSYNNILDLYLDGKLTSSCVLAGFPELNQDDLHVGLEGGFAGRIANLTAMNMAITQDEAYELYMKGPKLTKSLGDTLKGGFKSFADSLSDE